MKRHFLADQEHQCLAQIAGKLTHLPFHLSEKAGRYGRPGLRLFRITVQFPVSMQTETTQCCSNTPKRSVSFANQRFGYGEECLAIRSNRTKRLTRHQFIEGLSTDLLGLTRCGESPKAAVELLVVLFKQVENLSCRGGLWHDLSFPSSGGAAGGVPGWQAGGRRYRGDNPHSQGPFRHVTPFESFCSCRPDSLKERPPEGGFSPDRPTQPPVGSVVGGMEAWHGFRGSPQGFVGAERPMWAAGQPPRSTKEASNGRWKHRDRLAQGLL